MTSKSSGRTGAAVLALVFVVVVCAAFLLAFERAGAAQTKGRQAEVPQAKIPFPRPDSHSANWIEYHGKAVGPYLEAGNFTANACLTCHTKTDCISCHATRPPRDHTNTWRMFSHGFMAEGNRERCLTCHKQDFCVRCHDDTRPRSHTGSWRSRHCTGCHFRSGIAPADTCGICHRSAPHTSAPHAVSGQMDCLRCHVK